MVTAFKKMILVQMHYEYDCLGNVIMEERLVEEGIQSKIHYIYTLL